MVEQVLVIDGAIARQTNRRMPQDGLRPDATLIPGEGLSKTAHFAAFVDPARVPLPGGNEGGDSIPIAGRGDRVSELGLRGLNAPLAIDEKPHRRAQETPMLQPYLRWLRTAAARNC